MKFATLIEYGIGAALEALPSAVEVQAVGSALYRADAADVDIAVLLPPGHPLSLTVDGWEMGGSKDPDISGSVWQAYRRGIYNFLVMNDAGFYQRTVAASALCAELQLASKYERILVHKVIRDQLDVATAIDLAKEIVSE